MTNYPAFILSKSENDNKFYWIFKASNGRTLLRSVIGYETKQNAQKNIAAVLRYGSDIKRYIDETANIEGNGYYYWLHGFKKFKPDGSFAKIAISANGRYFQSVSWLNAIQGVNKSIQACVSQLTIAAKKNNCVIDETPDRRRLKSA
jgi:uncharacterized protein YegP (UPF0339 family)